MAAIKCLACDSTLVTVAAGPRGTKNVIVPKGGMNLQVKEKGNDNAVIVCKCGEKTPIKLSQLGVKR